MHTVQLKIDQFGCCPKCSSSWDAGDIFDCWRKLAVYDKYTDEQLHARIAELYSPPHKFSRLMGVEIPERYDGIWEWACPDCDARFPRFKVVK